VGDRGGGRNNEGRDSRTSMLGIEHDHVMSEFQRTCSISSQLPPLSIVLSVPSTPREIYCKYISLFSIITFY